MEKKSISQLDLVHQNLCSFILENDITLSKNDLDFFEDYYNKNYPIVLQEMTDQAIVYDAYHNLLFMKEVLDPEVSQGELHKNMESGKYTYCIRR